MKHLPWFLIVVLTLAGCTYQHPQEYHAVDSLNTLAYRYRYICTDSSYYYAHQALQRAADYDEGRAEAMNHLAYVRYQQMDFNGAYALLDSIQEQTGSQIELLCADVFRMKLAQRTGDGMTFFESRNRAEKRISRIEEEHGELTPHQLERVLYARSEMHIAASTYYFYLQQDSSAVREIQAAEQLLATHSDTAQWLYYQYMMGSGGLVQGQHHDVILSEFDYLFMCYIESRKSRNIYFEANALQALATTMNDEERREVLEAERPGAYEVLMTQHLSWVDGDMNNRSLPIALCNHALSLFREYADLFQTACALRTMGELHFSRGEYEQSLLAYTEALDCVNEHHTRYYGEDGRLLHTFEANSDSVCTEMRWIRDPQVYTLPEWISGIRQQLSVVYSALDQKQCSDYNRNVYIDLLQNTRQDLELETRKAELRQETRALYTRLAITCVLAVFVILLLYFMVKRRRQQNRRQMSRLQCNVNEQSLDEEMRQARQFLTEMEDETEVTRDEWNVSLLHISDNKAYNAERRAKVALVHDIVPFLDRIIAEVNRMNASQNVEPRRLDYIQELIAKINEYNDILTQWIQMSHGELSLHITSFPLEQLYQVLRTGHYTFDQKGVTLHVEPTDAVVKADATLTLFMLNTLADNARKFTPQGGFVSISTQMGDGYVEVSITDTGAGLSEQDVDTLNNSKVYDPNKIGNVPGQKGFGFGLMNCRGIIEKYRKTSHLFDVCQFGVESEQGRGSRFWFRLPRVVSVMLMLLTFYTAFAQQSQSDVYYDSLYNCNIRGRYDEALRYAELSLRCINAQTDATPIQLFDPQGGTPQEMVWLADSVHTDYGLLLALRNEVAVAALALHDWPLYAYNNKAYAQLYRLLTQDDTLPHFVAQQKKNQTNSQMLMALMVMLIIAGVVLSYFAFFRKSLRLEYCIRQLELANQDMLLMANRIQDYAEPRAHTGELMQRLWLTLQALHHSRGLRLHIQRDEQVLCDITLDDFTRAGSSSQLISHDVRMGTLEYDYAGRRDGKLQQQIERYVAQHLSGILYWTLWRRTQCEEELQDMQNELRRAQYEEGRLYVQNQVLDNCLSTIKHESMYYPSRIHQLADGVRSDNSRLPEMSELVHYYKEIYTLLTQQADRQVMENNFNRGYHMVTSLLDEAQKAMRQIRRKQQGNMELLIENHCGVDCRVRCDLQLMSVLFRSTLLIETEHARDGRFALACSEDSTVVRFTLTSPVPLSAEECATLFYPDAHRLGYLVTKQIIRDHDAYTNHPGLRLIAEPTENGHMVWFTISK